MKQWFHNLKVSQKLMLISVFFVMPDALMLYLFITGINVNIEFARKELRRCADLVREQMGRNRFLRDEARVSPSPGTPGEGWGEGSREVRSSTDPRQPRRTLTLPSPGVPGEGKGAKAGDA